MENVYTIKLTWVQRLAAHINGRWVWAGPTRAAFEYVQLENDAMKALQQVPAKDLRWVRADSPDALPAEPGGPDWE